MERSSQTSEIRERFECWLERKKIVSVNREEFTAIITQGIDPGRTIEPTERKEIIVGILVAMFLAALDQTIAANRDPFNHVFRPGGTA
jgi:hypothetical protein